MNAIVNGTPDLEVLRSAAECRWFGDILPANGIGRDKLDGRHHPCPKCGGTDRFRAIDPAAGAVICSQCFSKNNGDGFAALMWINNCSLPEAKEIVDEIVGAHGRPGSEVKTLGIVEQIARLKRMPLDSYLAFGAHEAKRGKLTVARVPMFDEHRKPCSYFDMADVSPEFLKGMSAKKSPETPGVGLFVAEWPAPGDMVLVLEGVKDAAALHSLRFKAVGLPGSKMAAKFARVFNDCDVIIIPDLDTTGNASAPVTAARLKGIARSVRIARLPGEMKATDGDGVREILAKRDGENLLRQAIAEAVAWEPPNSGSVEALFEIDDPHRLAKMFVSQNSLHGLCSYRRHNELWHHFTGTKYVVAGEEELRAKVTSFVQVEFERDAAERLAAFAAGHEEKEKPPRAICVRKNLITDVLAHTLALTLIPSDVVQPSWLRGRHEGFEPHVTVSFSNGILNLRQLVSGQDGSLIPPTPEYFSSNVLPYEFDENAPAPKGWLDFLNEIWPDDPDSIRCLQEWFGLFLVPDTRHQKILLMVGPKRCGKGTIGRIIRALIGEQNVASPTLAGLATNFGLSSLVGRQVAIVGDARLSTKTDVAVITERLLQISGEDGVTIDRKNISAIHTTLSTRFVLMTNELPRLTDASNAMAGRFVILKMVNSFYGREDQTLTEKLLKELPGIMVWAIEGWRRLSEQRRFTIPESSQDMITQLEDSTSPVGAFVRENCETRVELEIDKDELFRAWKDWCSSEGQTHPGNAATFAIQLRAVVPRLGSKRANLMGSRIQRFTGIALKSF
jgi:P4 family phage/plasmid primase-like protien